MNESRIEELLEEQNHLLTGIIEAINNSVPPSRRANPVAKLSGTGSSGPPLTQDDYDALDEEIDLEWWFETYGETPLPAKYMNRKGLPFSREESTYLFRRLCEIADMHQEINDGRYVWVYDGKTYCKAEKNTLNCFRVSKNYKHPDHITAAQHTRDIIIEDALEAARTH